MKRLFEFLLHGCWHSWEETERKGVTDRKGVVIGYAAFCRCKKCGMPKRFNLYNERLV